MIDRLEWLAYAVAIGIGATAFMDLWALFQRRVFHIPLPNIGLLGRWLGHVIQGRFRHEAIAAAQPVAGELAIGWVAHYLVGIVLAALLLAICGMDWARRPSLWPALAFGIVTVLFPYLILQPAYGLGVAASRAPQPNVARRRSLVGHVSFGFGLYLAACLVSVVAPE